MRWHAVILTGWLLASAAWAQRVVFFPFAGVDGADVRDQMVQSLCDAQTCVDPSRYQLSDKALWKKLKKDEISYVVEATVFVKGNSARIELWVRQSPVKVVLKESFPLIDGRLSRENLERLGSILNLKTKALVPLVKHVQPIVEAPKKVVTKSEDHLIELEVGLKFLSRDFSYQGLSVGSLRPYHLGFYFAPSLRAEFYPFVRSDLSIVRGLGIEGALAFTAGLKSGVAQSTSSYPTSLSNFDAALRWRVQPWSDRKFSFTPYLGIHSQNFITWPAEDGTRIEGLVSISYWALKLGSEVYGPLWQWPVALWGRMSFLQVLSASELVGNNYFHKARMWGVEGAIGIEVRVEPWLAVRASFEGSRYHLNFFSDPTNDQFVASGSNDIYLSGNVVARFGF